MPNTKGKIALAGSAFRRYLADLSASGTSLVAGERTLAEQFAVSRQTVRQVIAEALASGIIRRSGRRLINTLDAGTLAGCGRILFISVGKGGEFIYPAMKRLYETLAKEVASGGGEIHCFLTGDRLPAEKLAAEIDRAEVILLAIVTCREIEKLPQIIEDAAEKKVVIRLCGTYSFIAPEMDNFITADNYQIGKYAAKLLMDSNCRKPLALWKMADNKNFFDRAQGFCDTLFQAKCGGVQSVFWLNPRKYTADSRMLLQWAMAHGYDGFFVMSDEKIGEIASMLYDRENKKWFYPLVTVDGSGDSQLFDPPVCAVGHGTVYCCSAIMETLHEIADKKFKRVRKLIKPNYHSASSLTFTDFK